MGRFGRFASFFVGNVSIDDFWRYLGLSLISGGTSGAVSLAVLYPLDFARTRVGTDVRKPDNRQFRGSIDCLQQTYRKEASNAGVARLRGGAQGCRGRGAGGAGGEWSKCISLGPQHHLSECRARAYLCAQPLDATQFEPEPERSGRGSPDKSFSVHGRVSGAYIVGSISLWWGLSHGERCTSACTIPSPHVC